MITSLNNQRRSIEQEADCRGQITRSNGFSLPEVTMAVGIASMAIVLLLGLIPSGLSSIREASVTLSETRIFQQVIGEIQGADWGVASGDGAGGAMSYSRLPAYNGMRRFFDDQGTPLASNQAGSLRLGYVVQIRLNANGPGVAVPGGTVSPNMVAVTIDVAAVPDAQFNFDGDGTGRDGTAPFKSRTFIVTRQF